MSFVLHLAKSASIVSDGKGDDGVCRRHRTDLIVFNREVHEVLLWLFF